MSPSTCGQCVVRNAAPETVLGYCTVAGAVVSRVGRPCASGFARAQLNGPVVGFAKGKTWPELINGSGP